MHETFTGITLNTEGDREFGPITKELLNLNPDIVFLQETYEVTVQTWAKLLGMEYVFFPMIVFDEHTKHNRMKGIGNFGIAILTKHAVEDSGYHIYSNNGQDSEEGLNILRGQDLHPTARRAVLWAKVKAGEHTVTIATTHPPVSSNGTLGFLQIAECPELLRYLEELKPDIIAGDFNAPTTNPFGRYLESRYRSHQPRDLTTTLTDLHRVKGLKHIVDYVLTPRHWEGKAMIDNNSVYANTTLSDHAALSFRYSLRE